MFRFIHAADLHLDSPLKGLVSHEGAPAEMLRLAPRRALENLVQLALEEAVDFVLIAGDVYDGDWPDYKTGLFFAGQMARLKAASIPVYLISGNHDADNTMTRQLQLPDNVLRLPSGRPRTERIESLGVAIHGQGFAKGAVTENLAQGYPTAEANCFNIGLLHTSLTGDAAHDTYAPCTLDDLRAKGYDYWALGHIHKRREILARDPFVAYSGNLQGRHIQETGPKGCLLATVDERRAVRVEFRALDVLRWELCRVDITGAATPEEALDRAAGELQSLVANADGRLVATRVELCGACPAHESLAASREKWTAEIRARSLSIGHEQLWIEKVKFRTSPARAASPAADADGPFGELSRLVEELAGNDAELMELAGVLDDLRQKMAATLGDDGDDLPWKSAAELRELLASVEPLLRERLLPAGERA